MPKNVAMESGTPAKDTLQNVLRPDDSIPIMYKITKGWKRHSVIFKPCKIEQISDQIVLWRLI